MSARDSNPALGATAGNRRLWAAIAVSAGLHFLALGGGNLIGRLAHHPAPSAPALLQARLAPPPATAPALSIPGAPDPAAARQPAPPAPSPPVPAKPRRPAAGLQADLAAQASRQVAQRLLYPEEAVVRGLEGEAVVMLFLDANGNATAVRLERSSGHAVLDDAAVAAARHVSALPEGEPREVVLPVRFRLR